MKKYSINFRWVNLGLVFTLAFVLANNAFARKKKYLKLGKQQTLASEGIKFKIFRDAVPRPLTGFSPRFFRKRDSNEKIDVFAPKDLWFRDQHLAEFKNDLGLIVVGKVTLNYPTDVPRFIPQYDLVTKEAFEKWKEEKESTWDDEQIKTWVEKFANAEIDGEPKTVRGPQGCVCQLYKFQGEKDYQELYLVTRKNKTKDRYAFLYTVGDDNLSKNKKAIYNSLKSLCFFTPKRSKTKLMTTRKSKKKKQEDWTPEYIASRERVIKNIENLDKWWYAETDNFIIASNIKQKKTIGDLQVDLERARKAYQKYFPIRQPLKAVSVVRVFSKRDGYIAYLGEIGKWSGGIWSSRKKELVISPVDWLKGAKQRKEILRVTYHEGFHQYIYYVTGEVQTAAWFNEGHAAFFEGVKFKGNKFRIGLSDAKNPSFQKLLKSGDIYIPSLIKMSYREYTDKNRIHQNYGLGWALTYFLQKGAPVMKEKNDYPKIISRYYDTVIETRNAAKATEAAWKGVDMEKFNKDFLKFWNSRRMVTKSISYDPVAKKK